MPDAPDQRFLVVRLGSLGDLVHTIPAVAAMRASFPLARIDWVVERKWSALLDMVAVVDGVIPVDRTFSGLMACTRRLRTARYGCSVDFQGLYKSAVLARLSGASRRIGFDRSAAREAGASCFYTDRVHPAERHVAEMNLDLAVRAGVQLDGGVLRFPLAVPREDICRMQGLLAAKGLTAPYFVMSPGGGWKSKCWPPERYGLLCAEIWRRYGLFAVVNAGPGEESLAAAVVENAAPAQPVVLCPPLKELAALLAGARLMVGADTGPLHLAAALGTPVVALFGPTDPKRNGPRPGGVVVRNAAAEATTYKRGDVYSPAMLSIDVNQVLAAAAQQLSVNA
jgi:lipopolysaccharide heptosyltransferase I